MAFMFSFCSCLFFTRSHCVSFHPLAVLSLVIARNECIDVCMTQRKKKSKTVVENDFHIFCICKVIQVVLVQLICKRSYVALSTPHEMGVWEILWGCVQLVDQIVCVSNVYIEWYSFTNWMYHMFVFVHTQWSCRVFFQSLYIKNKVKSITSWV